MLKTAKLTALRLAESTGLFQLAANSAWRRNHLLILCYHGVSRYDEHEWDPLYISAETLRRRLELIRDAGCTVLLLGEALVRLQNHTLPERSVVLTFDDGLHDFRSVALPLLESFGFPVTLYLSTYYVEFNRPVFDPMCSYLLWKARHLNSLSWPEIFPGSLPLDPAGRVAIVAALKAFASQHKLSGREKDLLLAQLASRLGLDYEQLCLQRILHLVTPQEAADIAKRNVDIQYHTHRHRVYRDRESMFAELKDNLKRILSYSNIEPRHFCYTGGFYLPQYPEILRDYGLLSATTCISGYCSASTNPFLLPRLVDTPALSDLEFRSWLTGFAKFIPKRSSPMSEGQLLEESYSSGNS